MLPASRVVDGEDIAAVHQRLRLARGLTQRELAKSIGVDVQAIRALESGQPTLYMNRLLASLASMGAVITVEARS